MPRAVVTGVVVGSKTVYMHCAEEYVSFEASTTATFDKPPEDKEVVEEIARLFKEVIDPAIKKQVKQHGEWNDLFRLAMKLERPKVVKRYRRLLEKREE